MKKIPTLFKREFENHSVVRTLPEVTEGMEWVLNGEGEATIKMDGSCCAIINGELYKRYDAKRGKKPPEGAIPCCDPDPVTGHWPHWVKVYHERPSDKWFVEAFVNTPGVMIDNHAINYLPNGTYEAIGPHFQGNPYGLTGDILVPHGVEKIEVERSYEGIKQYLTDHYIEGIVFWKDGEPKCKIKRSDFGLRWNKK
jgi:hypothetical protein